jgi:hypothetical protein
MRPILERVYLSIIDFLLLAGYYEEKFILF